MSNWLVVGRFGRPHGIKGFITVQSFTESRDNILNYTDWHVSIKGQWIPLALLEKESNERGICVRVKDYSTRECVAALTNLEIAIDAIQLPSLNEGDYYWRDLIGLRVINVQGVLLGTVVELMETGANDVLVVEGEKAHLIPYLPEQFVLRVDINQGMIEVDWDEDF